MRKIPPAATTTEAASLISIEDVRERLWRALPSVQKQQCMCAEASKGDEQVSQPQPIESAGDSPCTDVHRDTGLSLRSVVLPRAEMAHLVSCVYLALHGNAIERDTEVAVEEVLRALSLGQDNQDEESAEAVPSVLREAYTKEDFIAFLESVPARWVPDMIAAQENHEVRRLWIEFNNELVDCVVSDEAPHNLLQPTEVFTIQRTATAVYLEAPLTDYIEVLQPRSYPAVYDTLFEKLQVHDDRSTSTLSLQQFRILFQWFYGLHFGNTNAPRSNAAADDVYHRYCDPRGQLTVTQFQLACEEMCAVYAQRRDAAVYLQQLLQRTEQVMSQPGEHSDVNMAQPAERMNDEFFLHSHEVTLPSWRRNLTSPVTLYLPDELRAVQQEVEHYHRHRSPRILLLGPAGIGKSEVGQQLAEELHCVHLNVLELAMAALSHAEKSEVAAALEECLAHRVPVPMNVQVRLLHDAMTSARAEYRGYVFSDTMSFTADTADAFNEHFVRALQLSETARPDHVVEVCTAVPKVYDERAKGRADAAAAASRQAWDAFVKDEAAKARAVEKAQMREDCEKILAHLVELEGATGKAAPPAADLELARQKAAEAQDILQALEENSADVEHDFEDFIETSQDLMSSPRAEVARKAAEVRLRLSALIRDGRAEAGVQPQFSATEGAAFAPSLEQQDWISCWRKHIDFAKSLSRYIVVDPIASASIGEVTSYIVDVFRLYPCNEPGFIGVGGTGEGEDDDADGGNEEATSVAADEERGRAVEEAAREAGLSLSPVWKRYCPVTALEDQVLIEGAACYACAYRGCFYCFASASKRAAFMDFPVKYLRQYCSPDRRPVLVVADDALVHSTSSMVETMQQVVAEVAVQLNLTPYTVSEFVKLLEPRQALLLARYTASVDRQKAEEEARKARAERQELAAKAQAKKGKRKVHPTKPKLKKRAGKKPTVSIPPQTLQSQLVSTTTVGGAPRGAPSTLDFENPQNIGDERAMHIRAAKEKAVRTTPLLLSAVTSTDLESGLLRDLWDSNLLPETVVVLRPAGAPAMATTEVGNEDDEETERGDAGASGASVLSQVLVMLEKGSKLDQRVVPPGSGSISTQQSTPFNILFSTLPETPVVHEVIAEVVQLLNPLSIQPSEAAVDDALGEEEEDVADEEAEEEAEEAAFLNPDGEMLPQAPRSPRNPLARPMRRFLHQFGSRLNYCPVTLRDHGILVRGRSEFCLHFVDGLYVFTTQEARDMFARCPQRYIGDLPPETLPPRMWLVGATHSGKKTLAAGLLETYRVPFFVYDRHFFEECIKAVLTPGGGLVRGVYIPQDSSDINPYVGRAHALLEELREKAKEEKAKLKARAEAERLLQEREQREEERAARSDADLDEEESEEDDDWNEEKEAELQEKLDFEPEDPEEKQARLNKAYLRIASYVTRFRPFDTLGYVMICPPFSDDDLDVLFEEGCVPEVVVRLNIEEETCAQRSALRAAQQREAAQHAGLQDAAAKEKENGTKFTQATRAAARQQRRREKALRKWRRRHIGVNDVDSPSDAEDEAEAQPVEGYSGEPHIGASDDDSDVMETLVVKGDTQPGLEDDYQAQEVALDEFMDGIEERHVEVVQIDGRAAIETVRRAVVEALGRHLRDRASLFYVPEVLHFDDAKARLADGGFDLSSFGYEDPVRLYRCRQEGPQTRCVWKPAGVRIGVENQQQQRESARGHYGAGDVAGAESAIDRELEEPEELSEVLSDEVEELREVVERRKRRLQREAAMRVARVHNRLYFFENDDSLLRFVRDPWPFMRQPPPNPTLLQQPVASVYEKDDRYATEKGGDKQRVLADSVAFSLRVKCMSVPSLLAWGAVHPHWQALKLDCMLAAQQGSVDAALLQMLLTLYLSSAEVKRRGAVLHNLPNSAPSAENLSRVACAAPIVKVMTTRSAPLTAEAAGDGAPPNAGEADGLSAAVSALERHAAVCLPLPRPSLPLDASNLVAAVEGVVKYVAQMQELVLRERRAFPARLHNSYQVYRCVHRDLSEFGAFCPYEWLEHDDLVRSVRAPMSEAAAVASSKLFSLPATNEVDLRWGAIYLKQYFFFSSADYLERFLHDPTSVTDPSKAKPMPKHFPIIATSPVEEASLALEGCCPVLLYDTREFRGMRRVIQPVAKKGSLDCVVAYDGKLYALRNVEHMARFLRRPWQYVDGAHLPQVLRRPLPTGTLPSDIVDHEEYIQRQLYDPVALALLAVARERPIYPGLSVEESALKYIALYLKAHRDPDFVSEFEGKSYRGYFDVYHRRATLYQTLTSLPSESKGTPKMATGETIAAPASTAAANREYCAIFEDSMADARDMSVFNRLPHPSDSAV